METIQSMHLKLKTELINYIKAQYFGNNNLLLNALSKEIEKEGVLWQTPFLELPPNYAEFEGGFEKADVPEWLKSFFLKMSEANLGVYKTPFTHQIKALETAVKGQDVFVATGTGSGKTECFMWSMLAKLCAEAKNSPQSWNNNRAVRTIVMYPMNALVADQIGRLRRIIGKDEFKNIFTEVAGEK
ncbi:MAG: DEAD/DEAH box helicase, partial [Oscillospiraceae bacterium]|nr:DEAD/DEAH box helicase [Oscillospiraceae bacterium]